MLRALIGILSLFLAAAHAALAREYPTKPIRVLVPFAPGGVVDTSTRILTTKLTERLGWQFVVDNRPGGNGFIAVGLAAKATPDGHTLLMATPGPAAINQFMYSRMPYDTRNAFSPVIHVASVPSVLAVSPTVSARSMAELVALIRARPDTFNYGSAGIGSTGHLGGSLFTSVTGTKALHVPYRGSAPMLQDLIAGNIQFTVDTLPGILGHIKSGSLRALAVTTASRWPELPELPTSAEAGYPGVEMASWLV
ncbi:MAG: tripartite tricarboxylate transporter substrate binding protein, partial [Dehalococcoidia bacterium]|nr:tripartite tricarboxylate transporter substrate binding protein [Dehalococcoidia bacterium]